MNKKQFVNNNKYKGSTYFDIYLNFIFNLVKIIGSEEKQFLHYDQTDLIGGHWFRVMTKFTVA